MGKKFLKAASAFLVAVMICAMIAACGQGTTTTTTEKAAATTAAAAGATTAAKEELKPVTLKFYFFDNKRAETDNVWNAIAEKYKDKLNAKFDVQFIPNADYKDKLLVMAASGDQWDMNFDGDWLGYYLMNSKNAYLPLNDLLPQYAPDLYQAYQDSGVLKAATYKGNIVALPWTMSMTFRTVYQWRKDLAEAKNLGFTKDNIKTVEDVDAAVMKLKAAYPEKKGILEVALIDPFLMETSLSEVANKYCFNLNDPACKVIPIEQTPNFRKEMQFAKKWQDAGIIWKDVLTDKLDHNQLIDQGQLISKWGTHEFANSNRAWVEPGAGWEYSVLYPDQKFVKRTALANIVCISKTSKNPERVLMFLNLLQTDKELYDMVHYGILDKTYVLNGEAADYPSGLNSATSNYMEWGGRWALWKPQFMRPDAQYSEGFWQREADFVKEFPTTVNSPLDGFSFDMTAVKTEVAQRQQLFDDAYKVLSVGLGGDSDKAVDDLIAKCKAAGTDRITAEFQKQVDAFLASSK